MTEDEAYKVHIQYTFNAFCKIVIRHAAIDKILNLRRRWEREVSLDYFLRQPQRVIGVHIGRTRSTAGRHIQLALKRLRRLMEGNRYE